uniref:Uncharacterized protein n=1 Tax=Leersia perrieri TaxID=77586 RepID=A0A0D9WL52_9ORYZ
MGSSSSRGADDDSINPSHTRIIKREDIMDNSLFDKLKRPEIQRAIDKIRTAYSKVPFALKQPGDFNDGALCVGLLDAVSNIAINALLTAFLTHLFPYLPDDEAVLYIDAANAEAVAAARLVVRRRGMVEFDPCSAAAENALRCAAAAARHPHPHQFLLVWKLMSSRLGDKIAVYKGQEVSNSMIACVNVVADFVTALESSSSSVVASFSLEESWRLAEHRIKKRLPMFISKEVLLPPARPAMKQMLLQTIYGFYLEAMARLPTHELQNNYHRSLLMGGYCYGPLDPVSNIIVNTIWYKQRLFSSPSERFSVQMISDALLWRIAARSMYGLVSFLCTRYHHLSPDQAIQCLLVARANLQLADPNLDTMTNLPKGKMSFGHCVEFCKKKRPFTSAVVAYAAAATAAFHPDTAAQQEFLGSESEMAKLQVALEVLQGSCPTLSSDDIAYLSGIFSRSPSAGQHEEEELVPVSIHHYRIMSRCCSVFWGRHERALIKVRAALDNYNEDKVSKYSLHVICGVNELVSGPQFSKDGTMRSYNLKKRCSSLLNLKKRCSSLLNLKKRCSSLLNDTIAWCIPVGPPRPQAEHARCIYCEREGTRIVHPAVKSFAGRDVEFEKGSVD